MIKSKRNIQRRYVLLILALSALAIMGVFLIKSFIALVPTYVPGEAGYITELEIFIKYNASIWAGAYGFVVWIPGYGGSTPQQSFIGDQIKMVDNMFFDCMERDGGEIYASTSNNITWDTVTAGTPAQVDAFLGENESSIMSGTRTFIHTINVTLGTNVIYNVPAVHTYQVNNENSERFKVGVLADSQGNLIFVTTDIVPNLPETIFSNESNIYANFQTILPIPQGTQQTYYFYRDPFEVCPSGYGMYSNGTISGVVRDNVTGEVIADALVIVGSVSTLTNGSGYYSLHTIEGEYSLVGLKNDYEIYTDTVEILADVNISYNFTLIPLQQRIPNNGTLIGNVTDADTGVRLSNVTVSIGLKSTLTDEDGGYVLIAPATDYLLIGFLEGYYPYNTTVNISEDNITLHNFSLSRIPPEGQGPG
ncbi:carboxypeptidase-like regulatory domain-containing protein, partial [Candidatus Woesearchaeota archaeon]|nr:carboxypeptidase-like regulatory domain-containing protein [Candidatus Woesearchaeota archaeon]